jgi:glycosyltransferase involved in cell wall biosynthesis
MRAVSVVPAYQASRTVGRVVRELRQSLAAVHIDCPVIVVDDGSTDATASEAERAGAHVLRHGKNRGKGAALRTGLQHAAARGAATMVSVDADGQHPAAEAARLAIHPAPESSLVLGVRDLSRERAPRAHRISNAISNYFLSRFSGMLLLDTQCGLRRYPVGPTLALDIGADGYAFEAEAVLRAARAGWQIEQVPVRVIYPPAHERVTHFHVVRDPARIVVRVLATLASSRRRA